MKKDVKRMCVVCRNMLDKSQLIKITISSDLSTYTINDNKASGRGAYICKTKECIDKCIKTKALNRAYKKNIPANIYEDLRKVELNEG